MCRCMFRWVVGQYLLTFEMLTPRLLCTPEHSMHIRIPRLMLHMVCACVRVCTYTLVQYVRIKCLFMCSLQYTYYIQQTVKLN